MEVHSHGHDTLGVNKEADKVYNSKDLLAPPSSQIPAGENFTVPPSVTSFDVQASNDEGVKNIGVDSNVHVSDEGAKNVGVDSSAAAATDFSFPPATSGPNSDPNIPFNSTGVGQYLQHDIGVDSNVHVNDEGAKNAGADLYDFSFPPAMSGPDSASGIPFVSAGLQQDLQDDIDDDSNAHVNDEGAKSVGFDSSAAAAMDFSFPPATSDINVDSNAHVNDEGAENVGFDSSAAAAMDFSFPPATSDPNSAPDIPVDLAGVEQDLQGDITQVAEQPFDSTGVGQDLQDDITQVDEDDAGFDDMVILENDMVTSASLAGGPDTFQVTDIPMDGSHQAPIPDIYNAPSVAASATVIEMNVGEVVPRPSVEAVVNVPTSVDDGLPADATNVGEIVNAAADVDTEKKSEPGGGSHEVTNEEIIAIKGQKVVKKFGRKNFQGEVVDFDTETKWFKVVYEDGDDEDLELSEVKEILASSKKKRPRVEEELGMLEDEEILEISKEKRPRVERDADASSRKVTKKPKETGSESTERKPRSGSKSAAKSPKTPGTKTKGLKSAKKLSASKEAKSPGKSKKKSVESSAFKTPSNSAVIKEKGKGKVGTVTPKSGPSQRTKSSKVSRNLNLQSPKTQKRGNNKAIAGSSSSKKAVKSSGIKRKAAAKGETTSEKSKRTKKAVGEAGGDDTGLVGSHVKKDFDGTLYDGVVVKFDKKTQFYKVKYADGDQEDLELHELESILVQDLANTDVKDDKPAKLSSLSSLMLGGEVSGTGKKK